VDDVATPFVGRTSELRRLETVWHGVEPRGSACVLVTGVRGIGRTTLLTTFANRVADTALVLRARCRRVPADTLAPWAAAFDAILADHPDALAEHCPTDIASALGLREPDPVPVLSTQRLYGGMRALIAELAAGRRTLVVLDDVDRADEASWDFLDFLTERPPEGGLMAVLSAVTGSLGDEAPGHRTLGELELRGTTTRLVLSPLSSAALGKLAAAVLNDGVALRAHDWLVSRSRGNPYLATALVDDLRRRKPDLARLHALDVSPTVVRAVAAWTSDLPPDSREALGLLAVARTRMDIGDIAAALEKDIGELGPALAPLTATELVLEEQRHASWTYSVAHPLVRDALAQGMTAPQRIVAHQRVGRALLARNQIERSAPHLSQTASVSGDQAIDVLLAAVQEADRRGAVRDGVTLLGVLKDVIPAGDSRWSDVADALSEWSYDHRINVNSELAVAALREIDGLPTGVIALDRRAVVKARLATMLAWDTGDIAGARTAALDAIKIFRSTGRSTDVALCRLELAYMRGIDGDIDGMIEDAARVLASARDREDVTEIDKALGAYASASFLRGRFAEAEVAFHEAVSTAAGRGESHRLTRHRRDLSWCLAYAGSLDEARVVLAEARSGDLSAIETDLLNVEANVQWLAADFASSAAGADTLDEQTSLRRGMGLSFSAMSCVEMDRPEDAAAVLDLAGRLYGRREWFIATGHYRHAAGTLAWHRGELHTAISLLRSGAEYLDRMRAHAVIGPVLVDLAEVAAGLGDHSACEWAAERMETVAGETDTPFQNALASLARAWQHLVDGCHEAALAAGHQAAGALHELDYRALGARAQLAVATAALRVDERIAVDALKSASVALHACGALWRERLLVAELRRRGRTSDVASVLGVQALTPRENEIAALVAQRRRTSEIAAQLTISRRTVESHLLSIYTKVGVHSRDELCRALAPRDEQPGSATPTGA
jgi:DNA-binding CsgD family transcriptional regulator